MTTKAGAQNTILTYYYYDNAGRLSQLENKPGSAPTTYTTYFAYVRNANGAIQTMAREGGLTVYYAYDALDRQTQESWLNSSGSTIYGFYYNYDAASNRYFKFDYRNAVSPTTTYYSFDARNFMTKEWI